MLHVCHSQELLSKSVVAPRSPIGNVARLAIASSLEHNQLIRQGVDSAKAAPVPRKRQLIGKARRWEHAMKQKDDWVADSTSTNDRVLERFAAGKHERPFFTAGR